MKKCFRFANITFPTKQEGRTLQNYILINKNITLHRNPIMMKYTFLILLLATGLFATAEQWAAPGDIEKWWQLDLGKTMKLNRCEIFFAHPTLGHTFVVDKSLDGKNWQTVTEDKERTIRSPHIASKIGKTRYLRVRILDGTPGIWEVKVH